MALGEIKANKLVNGLYYTEIYQSSCLLCVDPFVCFIYFPSEKCILIESFSFYKYTRNHQNMNFV